jgi:hypothetical protein
MTTPAECTRVREFVREFEWSLNEFHDLPATDRGFARFLQSRALHLHTAAIWAHRHNKQPASSWVPKTELFIDLVRDILREWGMDSRAAELVTPVEFRRAVRELVASPVFARFEKRRDQPATEAWISDLEELWRLLSTSARVMESDSLLVGSSKLLHHLLPDVFPPIDRRYTWMFLSGLDKSDEESQRFRVPSSATRETEFLVFRNTLLFTGYVRKRKPSVKRLKSNKPMCGSVPKLIDNAIIAWESTP